MQKFYWLDTWLAICQCHENLQAGGHMIILRLNWPGLQCKPFLYIEVQERERQTETWLFAGTRMVQRWYLMQGCSCNQQLQQAAGEQGFTQNQVAVSK